MERFLLSSAFRLLFHFVVLRAELVCVSSISQDRCLFPPRAPASCVSHCHAGCVARFVSVNNPDVVALFSLSRGPLVSSSVRLLSLPRGTAARSALALRLTARCGSRGVYNKLGRARDNSEAVV